MLGRFERYGYGLGFGAGACRELVPLRVLRNLWANVETLQCSYGSADPVLHRMTEMILPWLNAPTRFSELFLDRYCLLLCTHVTKAYGSSTVRIKVYRSSLAPWQSRRVMELLAECLDGSLRLRTPAEECELSISHFARSFRRTFKRSAHQYLTLKRIQKAKRCFDLDVRPFRAVLQAGLSDQAAFSRTFKAVVGTSPRQWRREACHRDCQLSCRPSGAILCRRVVLNYGAEGFEPIRLIHGGWEARKVPVDAVVFSLDFPFYRTYQELAFRVCDHHGFAE